MAMFVLSWVVSLGLLLLLVLTCFAVLAIRRGVDLLVILMAASNDALDLTDHERQSIRDALSEWYLRNHASRYSQT